MQAGIVVDGSGHRMRCKLPNVPSMRVRLLAFACAGILAAVCCGLSAAPASADHAWEASGIGFGWIDHEGTYYEHAYVNASYAAVVRFGGKAVASVACRTISQSFDGFFPKTLCTYSLDTAVTLWLKRHPGWYSSGVSAFFYPHISPYFSYRTY